ncbi:probable glycosyl transferase [alpha proteobacterium BAL199]|jgi:rhamnosyltransferase subunit B|nr:probable glycosyl transferase [alpha proteobacterium BAL199]
MERVRVALRVLFGWEFGAGLGHLTRFRPVGDRLVAAGAEVVLALQDVDRAGPFLDPATGRPRMGYHLLQAPRWNIPSDPAIRKIPTHSFADVLRLIGYGHRSALAHRLTAWEGILDIVRPDVVMGDFSPTLNLAARGRVPRIVIGNGYTIPPAGRPMPPIRPWQEALEPFSVAHEAELLDAANAGLRARGSAPIEHLADALHGDTTFVFSLPMVDPYARYRSEPTLAPFNMPRGIKPLPWSRRRKDGVFLYMPGAHVRTRLALEALAAAGVAGEAYVSDLPQAAVREMAKPGLTMHTKPQDFATVMPAARLVIHHGGLSTAVAALMAGTPQLILPWNLEHLVTARGVEATGSAAVAPADGLDAGKLTNAIRNMLGDADRARKAAAAAATVDLGDPEAGVAAVLAEVHRRAGTK